jgi:hypothetical protein
VTDSHYHYLCTMCGTYNYDGDRHRCPTLPGAPPSEQILLLRAIAQAVGDIAQQLAGIHNELRLIKGRVMR